MLKNQSNFELNVSDNAIQINRPEPIMDVDVLAYKKRMDPMDAVDALVEGDHVLIVDYFSSGLTVLNALKTYLKNKYSDQSFKGQREFRSKYRELSHRLVLLVSHNKLTVRKSPEIGWLKSLYPNMDEFLLPFPQVQGLNSSWQWHEKGIFIPVLGRKIRPFYGTYFPTRFEHLILFDNWLKRYEGEKKSAIDVGIGSGVLTMQMLKHGFKKVCGTDSNPNAIVGINEELKRTRLDSKVELMHGDLFADCSEETELIVFNPPWLPASHNLEGIDQAIYYDEDLFPRFFAESFKHLKSGGRIALLFSNLGEITGEGEDHPIKKELAEGGRFKEELFIYKTVKAASTKTQRNQKWRSQEKVELWILNKI
ncbi:methyltransferase [Ancylomarina sp. 16SWW S1-10-2]|uniref:methyltransferase n=1 Tax=Ancylomarina sp. 16SWW S1-10-2 TaxID=2499681 RepID=UPI0012AD6B93|nr:methyltransferase [Ancylomarina sp. 16SWW S1-10-2]MRT93006.1 methyltransferase type 11 [Ancylomarina sp. 16SWW S1-10-2]